MAHESIRNKPVVESALALTLLAIALVAVPAYRLWARQVMSDVPSTAAMLGGCLLYLETFERPPSASRDFLSGLVVAVALLFRPVFAAMALPFVLAFWRQQKGFLRR